MLDVFPWRDMSQEKWLITGFFSAGIQFQKDNVHMRTWSFSVSGP